MLRLLHFPLGPFSRKVRILLREKELEASLEAVEPWRPRDEMAALNPAAEVPVLLDHDRVVVDSGVICEYLDETRPEPRLLGRDAAERAEVRRLVAWFDIKFLREVTDLIWREKVLKFVTDRATPNSAAVRIGVANLHAHLAYIGFLFEQRNWLAGDHISLADITAASAPTRRIGGEKRPRLLILIGRPGLLPSTSAADCRKPDAKRRRPG